MTYTSGELSIVCLAHNRRCFLEPSEPGYPVRVWHEGGGRAGGVQCSSARFRERRERIVDREMVLGELAAEHMNKP